MLTGVRTPDGLELTGDAKGLDDVAAALEEAPGSFRQIGLQRPDQDPARLSGIRVKVKGGDTAVSILRIGDVIHINGSAAKMAELAAALRAMTGVLATSGHAAVDGGSDALVVRRA